MGLKSRHTLQEPSPPSLWQAESMLGLWRGKDVAGRGWRMCGKSREGERERVREELPEGMEGESTEGVLARLPEQS